MRRSDGRPWTQEHLAEQIGASPRSVAAWERDEAAIERRGKGLPGAGRPAPVVEAARDLLEDLDEVLGDEPVPAAKD
jgi:DNA-binding XRE family transcriptional regulator